MTNKMPNKVRPSSTGMKPVSPIKIEMTANAKDARASLNIITSQGVTSKTGATRAERKKRPLLLGVALEKNRRGCLNVGCCCFEGKLAIARERGALENLFLSSKPDHRRSRGSTSRFKIVPTAAFTSARGHAVVSAQVMPELKKRFVFMHHETVAICPDARGDCPVLNDLFIHLFQPDVATLLL